MNGYQDDSNYKKKAITFHCCVLREGYSIERTLLVDDDSRSSDWLDNLPPPTVTVKKGLLIDLPETEGWIVRRSSTNVEAVTMEDL